MRRTTISSTRVICADKPEQSRICEYREGIRGIFTKVMEPFFRKRKKGEIVQVRISGTIIPRSASSLNDKSVPPPPPHEN